MLVEQAARRYDRVDRAAIRVQNLTFMGIRRPEFVPAEGRQPGLGGGERAPRRGRAGVPQEACDSIRR